MSSTQRIRDAFDRMQHVFAKRPAVALAISTRRARITDGLRCEARVLTHWMKQRFDNAYLPIAPPPPVYVLTAFCALRNRPHF